MPKHYAMNTNGVMMVKLHTFLKSMLNRDEWSASYSGRFFSGERYPVPI
jgi:hypothetical protein